MDNFSDPQNIISSEVMGSYPVFQFSCCHTEHKSRLQPQLDRWCLKGPHWLVPVPITPGRGFHKITEIGNNVNMDIIYYAKTKNLTAKCYPWSIEQQNITHGVLNLGHYAFRSNALLSELLRHVLFGKSVRSLNGYALLVQTKWSNSEIQAVQEQ